MEQQQNDKSTLVFIILGWVFSVLSLLVLPIVFGIAGIVFGALTISRGKKSSRYHYYCSCNCLCVIRYGIRCIDCASCRLLKF